MANEEVYIGYVIWRPNLRQQEAGVGSIIVHKRFDILAPDKETARTILGRGIPENHPKTGEPLEESQLESVCHPFDG